jgi:hypothetical protein
MSNRNAKRPRHATVLMGMMVETQWGEIKHPNARRREKCRTELRPHMRRGAKSDNAMSLRCSRQCGTRLTCLHEQRHPPTAEVSPNPYTLESHSRGLQVRCRTSLPTMRSRMSLVPRRVLQLFLQRVLRLFLRRSRRLRRLTLSRSTPSRRVPTFRAGRRHRRRPGPDPRTPIGGGYSALAPRAALSKGFVGMNASTYEPASGGGSVRPRWCRSAA